MCRGMTTTFHCEHCGKFHSTISNCTCEEEGVPEEEMEWVVHRTAGGIHPMPCRYCHAAIILQQRWRYLRQRKIKIANTFFQTWWDQHLEDPHYPIGINRVCDYMIQDGLDPLEVQTLRDNMYDKLAQ